MEPRFGHDFSRVRVHSGAAAEQSAREVNASAYTVGRHVVFASGRYAPSTPDGKRLLAHELAHTLQHWDTPAALGTLQRELDDPPPDPPTVADARSVLREAEEIARDLTEEVRGSRSSGRKRRGIRRLKRRLREIANRSPADANDPQAQQAADLLGQIDDLDNELRARKIERERTSSRAEKKRAERLRKARTEEYRAPKTKTDVTGKTPLKSSESSKTAVRAEGVAEASAKQPAAKPTPLKPPTAVPTVKPLPAPGPATAPVVKRSPSPVTARDVAAELYHNEATAQRMAKAAKFMRWGLAAWHALTTLTDAIKAFNYSAATLAHGNPFWKEIDQAREWEKKGLEVQDYYNTLDLRKGMPSAKDAEWESPSDLYQFQIHFMLTERHLHDALKEIKEIRAGLQSQSDDLGDAMAHYVATAVVFPTTSLVYGEMMLFADAARQMRQSLEKADAVYLDAQKAIEWQQRFAQAAGSTLEQRLRQLNSQGIFHDLDTEDLRKLPLAKFTIRGDSWIDRAFRF